MSASRLRRRSFIAGVAGSVIVSMRPGLLRAQDDKPFSPYITSPEVTVLRMLTLARVGAQDHVIDLGSGDGRIPITAATKFGASGAGVDLDARLVELSNRNARQAGVAERVRFERADVFVTDVRKATVVTLYLLPPIVQGLRAGLLRQLRPGSRIVSHDFPFEGWQADASETFFAPEKNNGRGGDSTVYLYIVPAEVHGRWRVTLAGDAPEVAASGAPELRLLQSNQFLDAELAFGGRLVEARDARVGGDQVRFTVTLPERAGGAPVRPWQFEGRVDGESMTGQARNDRGGELRWQARRTAAR
ncbi:MAG: methyltransferase domain-containing protein [Proteobacteria bacterium]|nr:methyltransferase domain-containing protein [Burkholderiales bacterium]